MTRLLFLPWPAKHTVHLCNFWAENFFYFPTLWFWPWKSQVLNFQLWKYLNSLFSTSIHLQHLTVVEEKKSVFLLTSEPQLPTAGLSGCLLTNWWSFSLILPIQFQLLLQCFSLFFKLPSYTQLYV